MICGANVDINHQTYYSIVDNVYRDLLVIIIYNRTRQVYRLPCLHSLWESILINYNINHRLCWFNTDSSMDLTPKSMLSSKHSISSYASLRIIGRFGLFAIDSMIRSSQVIEELRRLHASACNLYEATCFGAPPRTPLHSYSYSL
jgi:hypothetical protein